MRLQGSVTARLCCRECKAEVNIRLPIAKDGEENVWLEPTALPDGWVVDDELIVFCEESFLFGLCGECAK